MRSRNGARWVLVALTVVFAAGNVAVTVHRSLIPVAVEGMVEDVEVREEKHPGIDDVWLIHVAGQRLHADAEIAAQLTPGQRISKNAWASRLKVGGTTVPLSLSSDAVGMLWLMPLVLALSTVVSFGVVRASAHASQGSKRG